jgi:hypothetical protein
MITEKKKAIDLALVLLLLGWSGRGAKEIRGAIKSETIHRFNGEPRRLSKTWPPTVEVPTQTTPPRQQRNRTNHFWNS